MKMDGGGHEVEAEILKFKRKKRARLPHSLNTVEEENRQPEGERLEARRRSHF